MSRDDQRFTRSPDVVSRTLDGEAVLLDLASSKYLGLNEVATRIWELMGAGRSMGEIRETLLGELDVAPEVLARDVDELVESMQTRGLIREAERG